MKTVQNIEKVTLKVTNADLIDGKWIHYQLLSNRIAEIEKQKNLGYKSLRTRLYNSCAGGKYNIETKAGLKCIDIEKPMKSNTASLVLEFVKE